MKRTPFAVYRQIRLAVSWYGTEYVFKRHTKNAYNEPTAAEETIQTVGGIYHSSQRSFIELINSEGVSVKSKVSKGILCTRDNTLTIKQGDFVEIQGVEYYVTAVEPVLYSNAVIAYEISVEELVEGNDA